MKISPAFILTIALTTAVSAADRSKQAVDAILHDHPFGQQGAMAECKKIGKPVVPELINALKDPNTDWAAKGRLGATLEDVLKDEKNRDEKFLNDLEPLCLYKDSKTADEAVRAVSNYKGSRRAREVLRRAVQEKRTERGGEYSRSKAVDYLAINSDYDPNEAPFFKQILKDESPIVRARAAGALGRMGDKSGYEVVREILQSTAKGRRGAVVAFGEIGDPRAIPILKKIYDDPKDSDGVMALLTIKEIEFKQLDSIDKKLAYLKEAIYFGHSPARWAAQKLIDINDPRAMTILEEAASDRTNPGRDASRQYLQSRGITKEEWWH